MAKIIIVDDSNLARRTTRSILANAGHEIIEAEDGLSALERYFLDKPDVVLLDVTMREMDGLEVLQRLRQLDSNARVIIVTADVQSTTREMAEQGGATAFVMKPVSAGPLSAAVEVALKGGTSWT